MTGGVSRKSEPGLAPTRRFGRRGFARAQDGATAVEFALVVIPFLALLMGIMELGLIFFASITLENAVSVASRDIRTGEVKAPAAASGESAALESFRTSVCNEMSWLKTQCSANLTVDVRTFNDFQNVTLPNPVVAGAWNPGALNFKTGGPSTIVLVRAYYKWNLIAPMMNQGLQKVTNSGQALLVSTATFRTEPYPTTP